MRAIPTFTYSAVTDFLVSDGVNTGIVVSALSILGRGIYNEEFVVTVASGLTAYRPYFLLANFTTAARAYFSAEL